VNRDNILFGVCGVLAGFILGYFFGDNVKRPAMAAVETGVSQAAPAVVPNAPSPAQAARLKEIETALGADPNNLDLLVELANQYYDMNDFQHAAETYEKVIAKRPNDPDVLTDCGNSYRNVGNVDRALALYQQAQQVDPNHWQSALNLTLVYAYDKKDARDAQRALDHLKATWTMLKQTHPDLPPIPHMEELQARIASLRTSS
jgi:tetratricopeptide (TPR) repeat protein